MIGDVIYMKTEHSRRKAIVIAHKPGWALIQYQE